MKTYLKNQFLALAAMFCFLFCFTAIALAETADIPVDAFLGQVVQAIKDMGGLTGAAKVSAIIMLIAASMKVSVLRSLLWDKLGWAKALVGPVLGIVGALIMLKPLTLGGVLAWALTGFGAQNLHELLDALKGIPGIGPTFIAVIDFISKMLGGNTTAVNKAQAAAALKVK